MDIVIFILEIAGGLAGSLFVFALILRALGFRLNWIGAAAGSVFLLIIGLAILVAWGFGLSLPIMLFLMLAIGWIIYTFLRYRQARQDELFQVISSAVEAQLPLGSAIRAYLRDRPAGSRNSFWDILLLCLMPPAFVLWCQRYSFDQAAAKLASHLDEGFSLADSLQANPGIAPAEVQIAAAIGENTGRLATCLQRADRDRLAGAWLEVVPRLLYPLLLFLFIGGITTYLGIQVLPKLVKIFSELHEPLPDVTLQYLAIMEEFADHADIIAMAFPLIVASFVLLVVSPNIRWHLPLIGRLFRWEAQGLVLRSLGTLLATGRTVPSALELLINFGAFPAIIERRLRAAQIAVEQGQTLTSALRGAGLLPRAMVPLLETSERSNMLPWALTELGGHLAGRAFRLARRASLILSPFVVAAIGLLVAYIALAMFLPLIQLQTRLSV